MAIEISEEVLSPFRKTIMKRKIAVLICVSMVMPASPLAFAQNGGGEAELRKLVSSEPYVTLFEQAPRKQFSSTDYAQVRKWIEQEREHEAKLLEQKEKNIEEDIRRKQKELKTLPQEASENSATGKRRIELHCAIARQEKSLEETRLARRQGLDAKYGNQEAKIKVLQEWPNRYRAIQQMAASERASRRKFGDYKDVGFREGPFNDQKDDIKAGEEARAELGKRGLMPPEVESKEVQNYVQELSANLARHSDLKVPLRVTVLQSKEINAFALPGGQLFVNSGLVLEAETEAQLAGVLAHEIAHIAARHSRRLMNRATIAGVIFQTAQLAALIFTGGIVGPGLYYALQYGFYGLGLALDLKLLGVSRDYEIEADVLAAQYLWHAGYDPRSYIRFFDKMASKKGYVVGLSWFRTHPPFYERMEETYTEILYLPSKRESQVDSSKFLAAHSLLQEAAKESLKREKDAPSLRRPSDCPDLAKPEVASASRARPCLVAD